MIWSWKTFRNDTAKQWENRDPAYAENLKIGSHNDNDDKDGAERRPDALFPAEEGVVQITGYCVCCAGATHRVSRGLLNKSEYPFHLQVYHEKKQPSPLPVRRTSALCTIATHRQSHSLISSSSSASCWARHKRSPLLYTFMCNNKNKNIIKGSCSHTFPLSGSDDGLAAQKGIKDPVRSTRRWERKFKFD